MGNSDKQDVLRTITDWNDHFAHNRTEEYFKYLSDDVTLFIGSSPYRIEGLKEDENTRHVRAVLLAGEGADRDAALDSGASARVRASDLSGLRDTLEALMGVRH